MSLSTLRGKEIGQGAAFSGMMRQLGGSFGVAIISTFVSRQTQVHRYDLAAHLNVNDLNVQQRVNQLAAGLMRRPGTDSITARQTAYAMLDGSLTRQATLLSYMDVFLWIGVLFLVFVPVVLIFIKKGQSKVAMVDAH
jgi:DHA2 family multidrug resistance protein